MLQAIAQNMWSWEKPAPPFRVRMLFVGQKEYFERCGLSESAWAETRFVHFRYDSSQDYIRQAILSARPHIVVCFRPELIAKGLLRGLPCLTLAFTSEPLPRSNQAHHDLLRRLGYLDMIDFGNFDRLIHFDVQSLDFLRAKGYPFWRALPLPLDWQLYEANTPLAQRRGAVFVGRDTPYRDRFLHLLKRDFNILHIAHGGDGAELRDLLGRYLIGINLHNEDYPTFENRIPLHFACGNLVLTQEISPTYGLENEEDHIRFNTPDQLYELVRSILREPTLYDGVRQLGMAKRLVFDSEHVYRALVDDLYRDVALHGRRKGWN